MAGRRDRRPTDGDRPSAPSTTFTGKSCRRFGRPLTEGSPETTAIARWRPIRLDYGRERARSLKKSNLRRQRAKPVAADDDDGDGGVTATTHRDASVDDGSRPR